MAERYGKIALVNLRHNLLPYLAAAGLFCLAAPLFMGTKNLDAVQSAKVIEMYLSFLGIILLMPVFGPDMNREIFDVVRSKKESMAAVSLIRIAQSTFFLLLAGVGFLFYLKAGNCGFSMAEGVYAFAADACFLGGLGLAAFAVSDNVAFAYMIPVVYYIANIGAGKKYLGKLYLFSMQTGQIRDKGILLAAGIFCIVFAVWYHLTFPWPVTYNGRHGKQ